MAFDLEKAAEAAEGREVATRTRKLEDAALVVKKAFNNADSGKGMDVIDAIVEAAKGRNGRRGLPSGGIDDDKLTPGQRALRDFLASGELSGGEAQAIRRVTLPGGAPGRIEVDNTGNPVEFTRYQADLDAKDVKIAQLTAELNAAKAALDKERDPKQDGTLAHQLAAAQAATKVDAAAVIADLDNALTANSEVYSDRLSATVRGKDKVEAAVKAAKAKLTPAAPATT